MISIRHEAFMAVAFHLSFSKASEVLFISQPAVSKHIKALEDKYKTTLFERKGNHIALTPAGRLLFERLNETRKIQDQLEFELSTLKDALQAKGHLKLGASTTVALYIIPKVVSGFHQKYPDIKISLLNRNTDTIVKALFDGEINVGIAEGAKKNPALVYYPYLSDEVIAVCSAKSPIAKRGAITLEEVKGYPMVLREIGSGTLMALKNKLSEHAIRLSDLNVGVRMAGTEALKNFLKEDFCLGFLPKRAVLRELQEGELVVVKIENLQIRRDFFFIQRKGTENDGLSKAFITYARRNHNYLL
jgi:DNA-binding transcriptional LysR family regulator